MASLDDGLSRNQAFALIFETTSARNLLGYGVRALRNSAFFETTADPIMTMLSIGVEKLLKMSLGLLHLNASGAWPSRNQFKNVWRHDLTAMNNELLTTLRSRLSMATHVAVVEPALLAVETNAAWRPLVEALSRYGQSGRFYYLDALAESPQPGDDPRAYWDAAESAILDSDQEFRERFYAAVNDAAEYQRLIEELEGRIAASVESFWSLVALAAKHGIFGESRKGWGFEIDPSSVGTQVRAAD